MPSETSHYPKCQAMMRKIQKHNSIRVILALIILFLNIPIAITPLANRYGLIFVISALLYLTGILISFLFSVPETPKICIIPLILIIMGIISKWLFVPFAVLLLMLLILVIPDYHKLKWLKTQKGYPQFSLRFDEQMQNFGKDYQPEHHLDHVTDAEMPDVSQETPSEETPSTSESIAMPDISNL